MKLRFILITIVSFFLLNFEAFSQVAGSFDIHAMKWRWGATTEAYLNVNGFKTGARVMSHSAIYGSGSSARANLKLVRAWLIDNYPSAASTGYLILDWETGPYVTMRKKPVTNRAFKAAEAEIIRLIDEVKRVRPNVKISMYQMPYRFWHQTQNKKYNGLNKFNNIFAKLDFIAPSYYIIKADEEVGLERNLQYLRENLDVALAYGKKFNKPVIPFVWHKIHPTESPLYKGEIMQKEKFARYIKYIYTYSSNNYKAAGVWWWDGLATQLDDLSGINNCLKRTVYNKATYDAMIVDYAKHVKHVLTSTTVTAAQKIVSYTLVNADTDKDIQTIANGATLNLANLPTKNLNIRVNTEPATVGSVKIALTGKLSQRSTESITPYSLFGGEGNNYNRWVPGTGRYTLKATPYTEADGGGTAGAALTINFFVINQATNARFASTDTETIVSTSTTSIYPNPVATTLYIQLSEAGVGLAEVYLHDLAGKTVLTKSINNTTSALNTNLDVRGLTEGVYILLVNTPKGRTSRRIVVQ